MVVERHMRFNMRYIEAVLHTLLLDKYVIVQVRTIEISSTKCTQPVTAIDYPRVHNIL